jgi:hypothetical protein
VFFWFSHFLRYKEELTQQQKVELKHLTREKSHAKISSEINRELTHSKCRGESGMLLIESKMLVFDS